VALKIAEISKAHQKYCDFFPKLLKWSALLSLVWFRADVSNPQYVESIRFAAFKRQVVDFHGKPNFLGVEITVFD
jgi:hypothetical protein